MQTIVLGNFETNANKEWPSRHSMDHYAIAAADGGIIEGMMRAAQHLVLFAACGGDGEVEACEPANACSCMDGTARDTRVRLCRRRDVHHLSGDNIEFTCDGNAASIRPLSNIVHSAAFSVELCSSRAGSSRRWS